MGPLLLIVLGVAALGVGTLVLRSFGPRFRVGRLLAATPSVTVAEAIDLASGPARYVAIRGRIDAEDEFEDDAHRPLVLRRARIQLRTGSDWVTVDAHTTAVAFDVREGLDAIAIDHNALDAGLVVVPRESVGTAADAPDRVPPGTSPEVPMRLVVEQVSSVEHAVVLGVPVLGSGDLPTRMTAGLGRPLILTTLEPAEAMRILAAGGPRRPLVAAMALGIGLVSLTIGIVWAVLSITTLTAIAASPAASAAGGDPRSSGQGPGLVGEPLAAVALVVAIGLVAAVATFGYVRLTGGRRQ
ncbi:MAG: hypothetical protein K0S97_961 [Chloroflexota bacterium]|nr:hypothetical protein [Chloroflexota bacterium]